MVLGELDSYMQKSEVWSPTYTTHKNKFKVNKRLKYKLWHNKSPTEEHRQENLRYSMQHIFTDMSPTARDIKERIHKWDLIKVKSFSTTKENSIKMKREPTVWENIFANDTSEKGLISKIYKELTQLHSRKARNPIKKIIKGPEQALLQGWHSECPKTYEKLLSITSHQRDAN